MSKLPLDVNSNPIPALRLKPDGAHVIAAGGTANRNATAFDDDTRVVSVYATQPVYLAFGNDTIDADSTDHYYPAGVYYDVALGGDGSAHYTHLSVIAAASAGIVYISEKI